MTSSGHKSLPTIGFLTVVEHAEVGRTGGYLVLNTLGRPLEFHCTAPVKTNRAQEILYGPTLRPFLFGEQIGQTLLEKSHYQPLFVCTDLNAALSVRETTSTPVALVIPDGPAATAAATSSAVDSAAPGARDHDAPCSSHVAVATPFTLGVHRLAVALRFAGDQQRITELWRPYAGEFDLLEPFERIREAIAEAQKGRAA
jgi:hypothetical protein